MSPVNEITEAIIGAAIEVHRLVGPGMLESTYETCMAIELESRNVRFERQKPLAIVYRGRTIENAYRMDLVVEGLVVVEIKAVECIAPVHEAQVLSYLRFSGCPVGLLLNFHAKVLKDGIRRVICGNLSE